MKDYQIVEVFWSNNWSESGEYITIPFASEEEARKWCDENSSLVEEQFPEGSNSYYKNGLEYRLTTPSC